MQTDKCIPEQETLFLQNPKVELLAWQFWAWPLLFIADHPVSSLLSYIILASILVITESFTPRTIFPSFTTAITWCSPPPPYHTSNEVPLMSHFYACQILFSLSIPLHFMSNSWCLFLRFSQHSLSPSCPLEQSHGNGSDLTKHIYSWVGL
jgi:hypothetical protein